MKSTPSTPIPNDTTSTVSTSGGHGEHPVPHGDRVSVAGKTLTAEMTHLLATREPLADSQELEESQEDPSPFVEDEPADDAGPPDMSQSVIDLINQVDALQKEDTVAPVTGGDKTDKTDPRPAVTDAARAKHQLSLPEVLRDCNQPLTNERDRKLKELYERYRNGHVWNTRLKTSHGYYWTGLPRLTPGKKTKADLAFARWEGQQEGKAELQVATDKIEKQEKLLVLMKDQLKSLAEKSGGATDRIPELEAKIKTLTDKLTTVRQAAVRYRSERNTLRAAASMHEDQMTALKAQYEAHKAGKSSAVQDLETKLADLRALKDAETARLADKLEKTSATAMAETEALRRQVANIRAAKDAEIADLHNQLEVLKRAKDAETTSLHLRLNELGTRLEDLSAARKAAEATRAVERKTEALVNKTVEVQVVPAEPAAVDPVVKPGPSPRTERVTRRMTRRRAALLKDAYAELPPPPEDVAVEVTDSPAKKAKHQNMMTEDGTPLPPGMGLTL